MPEVDASGGRPARARGRCGGRRDRAGLHLRAQDVRPAGLGVRGARGHRRRAARQVRRPRRRRPAPRHPSRQGGLAALVRQALATSGSSSATARSPCGCGSMRATDRTSGSTSPRPAPARDSPSTRCATRWTSRASPRSAPTRSPTASSCAPLLEGRRMQVKRLLRDQKVVAGIGNAYSDEILHAAKMSPFAIAADLDDEQVDRLEAAIRDVLGDALAEAHGKHGRRAQGRQAQPDARARPHGRGLPGLRRHRRSRCCSPTRPCSTARPARPAASRSRTAAPASS